MRVASSGWLLLNSLLLLGSGLTHSIYALGSLQPRILRHRVAKHVGWGGKNGPANLCGRLGSELLCFEHFVVLLWRLST